MKRWFAIFGLVFLSALTSCNGIPGPQPPEKKCPATCPLGTSCTDPTQGCQPIPPPGPVCTNDIDQCGCFVMPPETGQWTEIFCPVGWKCEAKKCVPATPPPPTCPTCPVGYTCTDPVVGCVKDPTPPPPGACPWKLSSYPGAKLAANTKPWGNGYDHTTLVDGSKVYCLERGWTDGRSKCQVAQDGDPNKVPCEIEFGGGCPRWEFRSGGLQHPCVDDQDDIMSCDHFGSTDYRDDPKTPTTGTTLSTLQGFEGQPQQCGLQRDEHGPVAGFFIIAHSTPGIPGEVRSCVDGSFSACGPWKPVSR